MRKLDEWLAEQKTRHSSLNVEQISKLLELGITFGARDTHWYQRFFALSDYVKTHGRFPERRSPLSRWLETQRGHKKKRTLPPYRVRLLNSLGIVWKIERKTFAERLDELKLFKTKHGHCHVPVDCNEFPGLGGYVATGIRANREKRTPEEIRQLDALGFVWDPQEDLWQQRFLELKEFLQKCGAYPTRITNRSLESWVRSQRKKPQSPERARQLKELGFEWANPREEQWIARYKELEAFSQKFGHCRVPEHVEAYRHLWSWLYLQKANPAGVSPSRRELLDQLGVDWVIKPRPTREIRMKELEAFFQRNGHCNVSISENRPLARWITGLRNRKSQLSTAFREKLEKMGMDWSPQTSFWNQRYAKAVAFKEQFSHFYSTASAKEDKALLAWLNAQRKRWARLTAEQRQRLIALDSTFCPKEEYIQ